MYGCMGYVSDLVAYYCNAAVCRNAMYAYTDARRFNKLPKKKKATSYVMKRTPQSCATQQMLPTATRPAPTRPASRPILSPIAAHIDPPSDYEEENALFFKDLVFAEKRPRSADAGKSGRSEDGENKDDAGPACVVELDSDEEEDSADDEACEDVEDEEEEETDED